MNISRYRFFIHAALAAGFLLILAASPVLAQPRSIKGTVTDTEGNPLEGVSITIEATDKYRVLKAKTNKKGEYLYLLGQQPGKYRVIARKEGFQPKYKQNISPSLGEQVTEDFQLSVGADFKFPFEMTDEERKAYMEKYESQKQQRKYSAAVKGKFDKGVELAGLAKYDEALVQFNEALELDPTQPGILARAGDIYIKQEKYEKAEEYYNKALEITPSDPNLLINLGIIMNKMGKDEESRKYFMDAVEANPSAGGQAFYNLGVTMYNDGNTEGATMAFKQCIENDPSNAEAHYWLGTCLANDVNTFPDAVKALEKYVEIGKNEDHLVTAKALIEALKM